MPKDSNTNRPTRNSVRIAALLASEGHVDQARALIAAHPPATVVIEVPVTIESRGRRIR